MTGPAGPVMTWEPWRPWLRPSIRDVLRCIHSPACWQAPWRPSPTPGAGRGAGRGARAGGRRCRGGRDPHGGPGQRRRGGQPCPVPSARDGRRGTVPRPVQQIAVTLAEHVALPQPLTVAEQIALAPTVADQVALPQPVAVAEHVALPQPLIIAQSIAVAQPVAVAPQPAPQRR